MCRDADENRVSHAYLVVSPDEGMSDALASLFIARLAFGGTDRAAIAPVAARVRALDAAAVSAGSAERA